MLAAVLAALGLNNVYRGPTRPLWPCAPRLRSVCRATVGPVSRPRLQFVDQVVSGFCIARRNPARRLVGVGSLLFITIRHIRGLLTASNGWLPSHTVTTVAIGPGATPVRVCVRTRVDVRIIVTVRDGKLVSPYGARLGYRHRSEVACDGNVTVCYGSYIHC